MHVACCPHKHTEDSDQRQEGRISRGKGETAYVVWCMCVQHRINRLRTQRCQPSSVVQTRKSDGHFGTETKMAYMFQRHITVFVTHMTKETEQWRACSYRCCRCRIHFRMSKTANRCLREGEEQEQEKKLDLQLLSLTDVAQGSTFHTTSTFPESQNGKRKRDMRKKEEPPKMINIALRWRCSSAYDVHRNAQNDFPICSVLEFSFPATHKE